MFLQGGHLVCVYQVLGHQGDWAVMASSGIEHEAYPAHTEGPPAGQSEVRHRSQAGPEIGASSLL